MAADIYSYRNIRERLLSNNYQCPEEDLVRLKDQYTKEINSRRRLDNITTLKDLIKILEKRNLIKDEDLRYVQNIAQTLNRHDVLELLDTYNRLRQPPPTASRQLPQQPPPPVLNHHPPADIAERIHEVIVDEIGNKWRDLARALRVGEGKIDELEERYRIHSDRVREILLHYERNCNTWFPLLDALSTCRRNDLRKRVQDILQGINL